MTLISIEQQTKEQILEVFENMNMAFLNSPVSSYEHRIQGLIKLEQNLLNYQDKIATALKADFNKSQFESDTTEVLTSLIELRKAKKELHQWIKPKRVATPIELFGTSHHIRYEPKGVVLIISPWNYPFSLTLIPLIAAWCAGNRIVIKPSEYSQHASLVLQEIIHDSFTKNEVEIILGDGIVANELVELPFNHIFFTGSLATAKKILKATANNLTPVTLELGGKTPVIIDTSIELKNIVKDIVYAKCLNAGQTCIAPDFILLPQGMQEVFVLEWNKAIRDLYSNDLMTNPDYCGIVHEMYYLRLLNIVQDSLDDGAELTEQIQRDPIQRKIKPILLINSNWDHASMQEENFGPVLPIIEYKKIQEALINLQKMNTPLTLYLFSNNQCWIDDIMNKIRSGGVTINNCLLNYCNFNLPFGGERQSGHGVNHGIHGFETFSHKRSVSVQGKLLNPLRFFYPPFTQKKIRLKNLALKLLGKL